MNPTSPDLSAETADTSPSVGRRVFMQLVLTGVGTCYAAAIGYPVYRYLASPVERATSATAVTQVTLEGAQTLAAGSAMMFKFGIRPTLLIHHKDDTWVALDAVCTHLGCTVEYEAANQRIHCACHDGVYDPHTGANVSGPPPRPLTAYVVKLSENAVTVSRS
jgi:cytochrome b6-f complex iron-sulfur subunit